MMRSPVFRLDKLMAEAPARVAPEKEGRLKQVAGAVTLCFEDQRGDFAVNTKTRQAMATAGALNLLWCASYAYWMLYLGFVDAQRAGAAEYRPGDNPKIVEALRLYRWALESAVTGTLQNWPNGAPQPDPQVLDGSPVHCANELFLVAIAWIFLHELGHIHLKHALRTVSVTSQQEEHDADKFATEWILDSVTDSDVILKRSLGMAVANIVLIVLDLAWGSPKIATHPKPYERLQRNLRSGRISDESAVHAFTAALLQIHVTAFGLEHSLNLDAAFAELVDDMCFDLHKNT
jgi:hypothetical protein